MSIPDEEGFASAAIMGLMRGDGHVELSQEDEEESQDLTFSIEAGEEYSDEEEEDDLRTEHHSNRQQRFSRYLPACKCNSVQTNFKGSIHLAFLSHACFIAASLFYVALSLVELSWEHDVIKYNVPEEIVDQDDDAAWEQWESAAANNETNGPIIEALRDGYDVEYRLLYVLGAAFFVLTGVLDWMRYRDAMNAFMIFAGAAGVVSALSDGSEEADVWDFVSVHLFLMEALVLFKRSSRDESDGEGQHACFRIGDACFLVGSVLDVLGSYFAMASFEGLWPDYTDLTACSLWLACSLIGLGEEIYYLEKGDVFCY